MNLFMVGIVISLIAYFVIGNVISLKVKTLDDYYVADRKAPTILITGSLVASMTSCGFFIGDCGEAYMGFFAPIFIISLIATAGYPLGATFFGKYLRRSGALTVPEYYKQRFSDPRLQMLAGIILICICFTYMLSAIDGMQTVMSYVTGWGRNFCLVIAWVVFTSFVVTAGSKGVLFTDTIMFMIFTSAAILSLPAIVEQSGGWFNALEIMADTEAVGVDNLIEFCGSTGWMYENPWDNFTWAIIYGVVWAGVMSVSPWQSSRYLMAKNEHVVTRSAAWSCVAVFTFNGVALFAAAMIRVSNSAIDPYSTAYIWAAQNLMPTILGVIFVTGLIAAAISSASTFLSLIGFSVVNDIMKIKDKENRGVKISKWAILIVSLLILFVSFFRPPMVWWLTQYSSSTIAASWLIVSFTSVWWKRVTKNGAFYSMLGGFLGSVITRTITIVAGITLPVALDPFMVGIYCAIIGLLVGTYTSQPTEENLAQYVKMHIIPEEEKDPAEIRRTKCTLIGLAIYMVIAFILLAALWAGPIGKLA